MISYNFTKTLLLTILTISTLSFMSCEDNDDCTDQPTVRIDNTNRGGGQVMWKKDGTSSWDIIGNISDFSIKTFEVPISGDEECGELRIDRTGFLSSDYRGDICISKCEDYNIDAN